MPIPSVPTQIPCPLCQEPLSMYVTTSKRGRHAIGLVCKRDGRHMRGFVNDAAFVATTIGKIAEAAGVPAEQVVPPAPDARDPSGYALQNHSEGPASQPATSKTTNKRGRST